MGIWKAFFNNTRKPEGLLGKCMVGSMNHAHAALADWGLSPFAGNRSGQDCGAGLWRWSEHSGASAKISGCDYYCSGTIQK